jgi:hypothetical protein
VAAASAGAVILFGIEGDDGVAAFPGAFGVGITAKANAVSDGPDADEAVELAPGCSQSRRGGIGVVEDTDCSFDAAGLESRLYGFGDAGAF